MRKRFILRGLSSSTREGEAQQLLRRTSDLLLRDVTKHDIFLVLDNGSPCRGRLPCLLSGDNCNGRLYLRSSLFVMLNKLPVIDLITGLVL